MSVILKLNGRKPTRDNLRKVAIENNITYKNLTKDQLYNRLLKEFGKGDRTNIQNTGINKLFDETVVSEPEKPIYKPDEKRDVMYKNMLTYKRGEVVEYNYILKEKAHSKSAVTYKIDGIREISISNYLDSVKSLVLSLIKPFRKVKMNLWVKYKHEDDKIIVVLPSKYHIGEDIYETMKEDILKHQILVDLPSSGFSYFGVVQLDLDIDIIDPLRVGSYIPLPEKIANKKAIINPRCYNDCFKWSVIASLHKMKNPQIISNFKTF